MRFCLERRGSWQKGRGDNVIQRMKFSSLLLAALALLTAAGCNPKVRHSTDLERKQAANLDSEADFAITLHDFARAEPLLDKATTLCPDVIQGWMKLAAVRIKLGDKGKARTAYEGALKATRAAYAEKPDMAEARIQEVYILVFLGRADDARAALAKAQKALPDNRELRAFIDSKQLDQLLNDPNLKQLAL